MLNVLFPISEHLQSIYSKILTKHTIDSQSKSYARFPDDSIIWVIQMKQTCFQLVKSSYLEMDDVVTFRQKYKDYEIIQVYISSHVPQLLQISNEEAIIKYQDKKTLILQNYHSGQVVTIGKQKLETQQCELLKDCMNQGEYFLILSQKIMRFRGVKKTGLFLHNLNKIQFICSYNQLVIAYKSCGTLYAFNESQIQKFQLDVGINELRFYRRDKFFIMMNSCQLFEETDAIPGMMQCLIELKIVQIDIKKMMNEQQIRKCFCIDLLDQVPIDYRLRWNIQDQESIKYFLSQTLPDELAQKLVLSSYYALKFKPYLLVGILRYLELQFMFAEMEDEFIELVKELWKWLPGLMFDVGKEMKYEEKRWVESKQGFPIKHEWDSQVIWCLLCKLTDKMELQIDM